MTQHNPRHSPDASKPSRDTESLELEVLHKSEPQKCYDEWTIQLRLQRCDITVSADDKDDAEAMAEWLENKLNAFSYFER